jgi:DNA repair exonuclease SbcCD ATPase subunit
MDVTDFGDASNGTGKSVIINAIAYAIFDKPISNISKDGLVNNINNKEMSVSLTFSKDSDVYCITRERKMKSGSGGNTTTVTKNDVDITTTKSSDTISSIMGISFEAFVRIVIFSATSTSFLSLPVRHATSASQTGFIEELFNISTITDKSVILKDKIKQTQNDVKSLKSVHDAILNERERARTQILNMRSKLSDWDAQHSAKLNTLSAELELLTGDVVDYEVLKADRARLDNVLDDIKQVTSECNAKIQVVSTVTQELKEIDRKSTKLVSERSHLLDNKCPYCKQSFADTTIKLDEIEQQLRDFAAATSTKESGLAVLISESEVLQLTIERLTKEKNELGQIPTLSQIYEMERLPQQIQSAITELQKQTNPYVELVADLSPVEGAELDVADISKLELLLEHQELLLKLVTKKDSFIRKTILSNNIAFLNTRIQYYLTELLLPYKMKINQDLTSTITNRGVELDYGQLSGGQQARVNLALSLSFRDVSCKMTSSINLLYLDEVLDVGLDSVGISLAAKLIKKKAAAEQISMYVITHRDELSTLGDRTLCVEFKNGFSSIKE